MKNGTILVTFGAGYSGNHVVRQLGAAGETLITLDNLSADFEAAVTPGDRIVGDTGNGALLKDIFTPHGIETIVKTSLAWERRMASRETSAYWPD